MLPEKRIFLPSCLWFRLRTLCELSFILMQNIFTASMKQSCKKSLKNRDYTRVHAIMSTYKFNKTSNQSLQGSGPEDLSRLSSLS